MHNHYAYIYNELVWNVLRTPLVRKKLSCLPARPPSVREIPGTLGWRLLRYLRINGGSLRGGLSIGLSGFGFWSHDIAALRIPLRRTFTNAGARLVCLQP